MNQLVGRSLSNTTDCSMNYSKCCSLLRHLKEMCSTLTLPISTRIIPANPPTVTKRGFVWHQRTGSQYVSWASGRNSRSPVENRKIQTFNFRNRRRPLMVSHPILSLWYDHATKVVLSLWVKTLQVTPQELVEIWERCHLRIVADCQSNWR